MLQRTSSIRLHGFGETRKLLSPWLKPRWMRGDFDRFRLQQNLSIHYPQAIAGRLSPGGAWVVSGPITSFAKIRKGGLMYDLSIPFPIKSASFSMSCKMRTCGGF